jgi:hypothetical protein
MSQNIIMPYRYASAAPLINDDNLKGYWKFDEASGSILNQSVGAGTLGVAADMTITGTPTYQNTGSPSGLTDASVYFDGVSDGGNIGTSTSQFNFMHNSSALWTVCYWMKFPQSAFIVDSILDDTNTEDNKTGFWIGTRTPTGGTERFAGWISFGTGNQHICTWYLTPTIAIPVDNAWHFYTWQYDQSLASNNFSYSVDNGTAIHATKTANTPSSGNAHCALKWLMNCGTNLKLEAYCQELSIWNEILDATDLSSLYASGAGAPIY